MTDNAVIIEPESSPTHLVVWLHGLGADGHDFEPIVPELGIPADVPVKFIFPHAPVRPITINGGMAMRGWYDISGVELEARSNEADVLESAARIQGILEKEVAAGIEPGNIILAGFSQGGLVALFTGLQYPRQLAGLVALSTYFPEPLEAVTSRHPANAGTPVFFGHGSLDPLVQMPWGRSIYERLENSGQPVEWHDYPMEHQVCLEEIQDLSAWIRKVWNLQEPEQSQ